MRAMDEGYWTSIIERGDGWIYSSGPLDSLHVWRSHLTRAGEAGYLRGRYAFVHNTRQYPITDIERLFPWDLWRETLRTNAGSQVFVVFDNTMEGPAWRHVEATACRIMEHGIDPRCIINWTGSVHEDRCPIQTVTLMDAFSGINSVEHCNPATPTHHFVMLARIPRTHRVIAAVDIIRRGLDAHGFVSCGSGDFGTPSRAVFDDLVPPDMRDRFPMMLPGEVYCMEQTMEVTINSTTKPEVTGAFCSIICETTHDICAPNVCTAFMTEKSEKCFLLGQVPIWVAAPGQAALAREWGFDLFDDIVDHGYDMEPDPHRRIRLAIDQLQRLTWLPMDHWRRYRHAHRARFNRNRERCIELRKTFRELQHQKLLACIDGMPPIG